MPIKKIKIKERRKTDINFQLSEILRSKIHKMIKGSDTSYKNYIGCEKSHSILKMGNVEWLDWRLEDVI